MTDKPLTVADILAAAPTCQHKGCSARSEHTFRGWRFCWLHNLWARAADSRRRKVAA